KGKGNALMKGPGGAQNVPKETPASAVAELIPSLDFLSKELKAEIDTGKMHIEMQPRGLVISMRQAAFFPSGGDVLDASADKGIARVAETIRALPNSVRLEGHTDSIPIHTARFRSNWEL